MQFLAWLASVCILSLFSTFTMAKSLNQTNQEVTPTGISYDFSGSNLAVVIDQQKLLETMPNLQKKGVINPRLSKIELGFYDTVLPVSVSMQYVSNIVKNIYLTHPAIDQIHVNADLLSPDLYGNNSKAFCYSFDFDRKLYQKINWDKFKSDNLKKIAPNFKTSDACQNLTVSNPASTLIRSLCNLT